jgi:hypothetical protein
VRLFPKLVCDRQGIDFQIFPPGQFIAGLMQLSMMASAEGYSELVADFKPEGSGLRKPQVMRVAGLPAAHEARLRGNEPQMGLVTQPLGLADGKKAFVDLRRDRL